MIYNNTVAQHLMHGKPSKTPAFTINILIIIQGEERMQCSMQKENEHIIAIKNKFIG